MYYRGARPKTSAMFTDHRHFQSDEEKLEICSKYLSVTSCNDPSCTNLHICKFFVCRLCKFGAMCKFGHDLNTAHNQRCLSRHSLIGCDLQAIKKQLVGSTGSTSFPWICRFYNSSSSRCKHGDDGFGCAALHVCLHYVKGDCIMGRKCKRNHNIFNKQCKDLLRKRGINVDRSPKLVLSELHNSLQEMKPPSSKEEKLSRFNSLGNLNLSKGFSALSLNLSGSVELIDDGDDDDDDDKDYLGGNGDGDVPDICMYNLREAGCLYKTKCHNIHCTQPFKWLYLQPRTGMWTSFEDDFNREIELKYSDPNNDVCRVTVKSTKLTIDFCGMTISWPERFGVVKIQRFSTKSWAEVPETQQDVATKWLWFWNNEHSQWVEYGKGVHKTELNSRHLEQQYLENRDEKFQFTTTHFCYYIDFVKMIQRNKTTGTERQIRRRPMFRITKQINDPSSGDLPNETPVRASASLDVPPYWDKHGTGENSSFKIVKIQPAGRTAEEFGKVQNRFTETMAPEDYKILSIKRIQNLELWEGYQWKYNWMKKKTNNSSKSFEKLLFHGTKDEYVDAIVRQGFDWRLSGMSTGTLYGKGSYFARDANYSSNYANSRMFLVRVLVGDYICGKRTYLVPPNKPGSDTDRYHSCVDNMQHPSIFVTFEHQQAYPEYIITYSNEKKVVKGQ